jgi:hypothetical protein
MAERRTSLVRSGWRKRVLIRPDLCAGRVIQDFSRITSTGYRIFGKSAEGGNGVSDLEGGANARRKTQTDNQLGNVGRVPVTRERVTGNGLYSTRLRGCHRAPQIPRAGCRVSAHAGDDPIAQEIRNPAPEAVGPAFPVACEQVTGAMLSLLRAPF